MQVWDWCWVTNSVGGGSVQTNSADVDLGAPVNVVAFAAITGFDLNSLFNSYSAYAGVVGADNPAGLWNFPPTTASPCYVGTTQHLTFGWAIDDEPSGTSQVTVSFVVLST
jgi:hypothetical protein